MNTKVKTILSIVLFIAFLGIAYYAYTALSESQKPNRAIQIEEQASTPEPEKIPAPDFTVFDAKGNEVKLSDFLGKPIVLNFWASWCPPCKSEMPDFNEVYADVKDDVVFMMVDLVDGQRETLEKGQSHVENEGFDFPVYFDMNQEAARTYSISSIPTTYIIDSSGNIITAYKGAIDKETLVSAIESIKK